MDKDEFEGALRKLSDEELDKVTGGDISEKVMKNLSKHFGNGVWSMSCTVLAKLCNEKFGNNNNICKQIPC